MFYNKIYLIKKLIFDLIMRRHVEYGICSAVVKLVDYSIPHYQKSLLGIGLR